MLEKDIQEAIDKHLSAEVSKRLQARLAIVDEFERKLESMTQANAFNLKEKMRLEEQVALVADMTKREALLKHNESVFLEEQWKLKVKEAELKGLDKGMAMNFEVVKAVFANSKLKYNYTDAVHTYQNGQSNSESHSVNGEREV